MLELLGPIGVRGLPWIPPGETKPLPIDALRSGVLCRKHNSKLSDFDEEGKKFLSILKLIDSKRTPDELSVIKQIQYINGIKLEKWLLKSLCAIIASGNYTIKGKAFGRIDVADYMVDLLFLDNPWPSGIGLYRVGDNVNQITTFNGVSWDIVTAWDGNNGTVIGFNFGFLGFPFLCLLIPGVQGYSMESYRPKGMQIVNGSVAREIRFTWPQGSPTSDFQVFTKTNTIWRTLV
jgi:hypothetical protein